MYTKEELQKRRAALSASKRELLAQQLRGDATGSTVPPAALIPARPSDVPVPLSSIQERFWFLQQLDPASVSYINVHIYHLTRPIDDAALLQAMRELMRRHEILRTTYTVSDGQVFQQVEPALYETFTFPIIDLQHLPEAERDREAHRLVAQQRARPLLLAMGPPWAALMVRVRPDSQILILQVHHLIADGWSIDTILRRELMALYHAFLAGQPSPLPELPIQYADYAYWQRQQLQGALLDQHIAYWTQHLAGAPVVLDLPTDYPRPAVQTYREAMLPLRLDATLTAALKKLCQQEQATLFMTLLAAFGVLVARISGQYDLIVGTSIAGRNAPELEPLLGCFINTLPLRLDVRERPSFRRVLQESRRICLGAYAHQDLPVEYIVTALQPQRDLSRSLLYQVMFQLQNYPAFSLEQEQMQPFSEAPSDQPGVSAIGQGLCDLIMLLYEDAEITGELSYDATLFTADTIARLLDQFQTLLSAIVADPDLPIDRLPLLSDTELERIVTTWNATAAPYPQDVGIHMLIERQAAQTPEAVAVVCGDQRWTYRELNARANQLARYLRGHGVAAGTLVGVCLERSPELIMAVLGVLKAGGAYIPLDPSYPEERLQFMLQDSQAALLLTEAHLKVGLFGSPVRTICLDVDQALIDEELTTDLPSAFVAAQPAYVIYTSGSTGRPKGVVVPHTNLVNIYLAWESAYGLHSTARRHLQMASFSFDVFSGDLVRALCSGGTLVICPRDLLLLPRQLYSLLRDEQIDCAEFVPAVLRNLVTYLEEHGERLDWMQVLICASDSWYLDEYERFRRVIGPQTRLINSFGLTETTIDSTFFDAAQTPLSGQRQVPIGRPFANTQMYVLDHLLQPLPIGVPGELYIGGAGVAQGYLAQPALTAARFIPDPFSAAPGQRLYHTGDRARYLPDGALELLGRSDHQVKIRGHRIELGELEALLAQHPAVHTALVNVTTGPGGAELVAYIVPHVDAPTSTPEPQHEAVGSLLSDVLRAFLRARVPEYMIPSAFVQLDALPLTPNGKLDRRALPDPVHTITGAAFVAPETPVEQDLAAIWSRVLKREPISIHDNFFALGGHSLLAGQILHQINSAFDVELPLRRLFEEPTIAELALSIEELWIAELESLSEAEAREQLM